MAAINKAVATGLRMKGVDGLKGSYSPRYFQRSLQAPREDC